MTPPLFSPWGILNQMVIINPNYPLNCNYQPPQESSYCDSLVLDTKYHIPRELDVCCPPNNLPPPYTPLIPAEYGTHNRITIVYSSELKFIKHS